MATNDEQRSRLVDALWKLKQSINRSGGQMYVHFSMLLNDSNYRSEIISQGLESEDPAVRELAQEAHSLNMDGKLVSPPSYPSTTGEAAAPAGRAASAAAGGNAPASQIPPPGTAGSAPDQGRSASAEAATGSRGSRPIVGIVVLAVLVILLGGGLGYLASSGNLARLFTSEVRVSGSILENTRWTADKNYVLEDFIFVEAGARLTIEPGTRIRGEPGSALIVTRDGSLFARGKRDEPIVFTSNQPEGQRAAGDWGGLVLLGNAPVNLANPHIEGIPTSDPRGGFGGNNVSHTCGVLEFVRVEFAGFEIGANNELNGITFGGCGTGTIARYLQSHMGLDDGIEMYGGTADLQHIVVTGAADDSFDWEMGWQGRVQFMVVQQHADYGDNGFEADNWKGQPDAEPRSNPTLYNVTMVGSGNPDADQRTMTLRRGTGGTLRNFIVTGFPLETIDIGDAATAALLESGELSLTDFIVFDIGADGQTFFEDERIPGDDGGLVEADYFARPDLDFRFGVSPLLPVEASDPESPRFIPDASSPAANGAAPLPTADATSPSEFEFWDEASNYLGALRPGATESWLDSWTAFPPN